MTPEAVAIVRTFLDRLAAGDSEGVVACLDPDVVGYGTRGGLEQERMTRGADEWMAYIAEVEEPWEHHSVEVERLVDAGDRVVAFLRETGQGRHGGPEVEMRIGAVLSVRNGKIVETRWYLDRDEALRAVGQ